MIALDPVVEILPIDRGDVVKMWIVPLVDLPDHLSICGRFVRADRDRTL